MFVTSVKIKRGLSKADEDYMSSDSLEPDPDAYYNSEPPENDWDWEDQLLQSKSYAELINYLQATIFTSLPHLINYPKAETIHVLITIATIRPHYSIIGHGGSTYSSDGDDDFIGVKAIRYLQSLVSVLSLQSASDGDQKEEEKVTSDNDPLFKQPLPRQRSIIAGRKELFKALDNFVPVKGTVHKLRETKITSYFPISSSANTTMTNIPGVVSETVADPAPGATLGPGPGQDDDDPDFEFQLENEKEIMTSPLKQQMDNLYDRLTAEDSEYPQNIIKRPNFGLALGGSRSQSPSVADLIYGNEMLYERIDHDFWAIVRWSFANAGPRPGPGPSPGSRPGGRPAESDNSLLKKQYIWKSWYPILKFILDIATLEVQNTESEETMETTFIAKMMAYYDNKRGVILYLRKAFIDHQSLIKESPIYERELQQSYKFVMTADLETTAITKEKGKFGVQTMAIRRQLVSIGLVHTIRMHNDHELILFYLDKVVKELDRFSYEEFEEFIMYDRDSVVRYKGASFPIVGILAFAFLKPTIDDGASFDDPIEEDDNLDIDTLMPVELAQVFKLQLKCHPNRSSVSQWHEEEYFVTYQKIVLCLLVLIQHAIDLESESTSNSGISGLLSLREGDHKRSINVQKNCTNVLRRHELTELYPFFSDRYEPLEEFSIDNSQED